MNDNDTEPEIEISAMLGDYSIVNDGDPYLTIEVLLRKHAKSYRKEQNVYNFINSNFLFDPVAGKIMRSRILIMDNDSESGGGLYERE